MSSAEPSERGYALAETLVALVIAAGVLTATMSGLASLTRGVGQADMLQQALLEARNIEARLRAGLPPEMLSERYPDWRIELVPVDRPVDPRTGSVLTGAVLTRPDLPGLDLRLIYLEAGQGGPGGRYGSGPG